MLHVPMRQCTYNCIVYCLLLASWGAEYYICLTADSGDRVSPGARGAPGRARAVEHLLGGVGANGRKQAMGKTEQQCVQSVVAVLSAKGRHWATIMPVWRYPSCSLGTRHAH